MDSILETSCSDVSISNSSSDSSKSCGSKMNFYASSKHSSSIGRGTGTLRSYKNDQLYTEMIKNTKYKSFVDSLLVYEVYINMSVPRWILLLKINQAETYISLEVTHVKLEIFEYNVRSYTSRIIFCGTIESKLIDILKTTNQMIHKMGYSDILKTTDQINHKMEYSDCQHFCNNFLNHYSLKLVKKIKAQKETSTHVQQQLDDCREENDQGDDGNDGSSQCERFLRLLSLLFNRYVGAN